MTASNNVFDPTGLIAVSDPLHPSYVDITVSGSNGIYTFQDMGGSTGAIAANSFTLLDAAPTNEAFYGISEIPVPEPTTSGIVALGAMTLLRRCRNAVQK